MAPADENFKCLGTTREKLMKTAQECDENSSMFRSGEVHRYQTLGERRGGSRQEGMLLFCQPG
jgi:hypothetical protein